MTFNYWQRIFACYRVKKEFLPPVIDWIITTRDQLLNFAMANNAIYKISSVTVEILKFKLSLWQKKLLEFIYEEWALRFADIYILIFQFSTNWNQRNVSIWELPLNHPLSFDFNFSLTLDDLWNLLPSAMIF